MRAVFVFLGLSIASATAPGSAVSAVANTQSNNRPGVPPMETALRIRVDVEGGPLLVALDDNRTSRDFIAILPLTLTLNDYAATEKVADLPHPLSAAGAPAAITPRSGDVAYYAPWGNLAIFYRDGHHSPGLVRLGRIADHAGLFRQAGPLRVTITLAEE